MTNKKRLVVLVSLLLPFFLILSIATKVVAGNNFEKIDIKSLPIGEKTLIETSNQLFFTVENALEGSLIKHKDRVLTKIDFGYIDKLTELEIGQELYVIVEYRYSGSGNILFFELLNITNGDVKKVYKSEEIQRGLLHIGEMYVELTIPQFSENDSFASPSSYVVEKFDVVNQKTVSSEVVSASLYESVYLNEEPVFQLFSTTPTPTPPPTYVNPSADVINRLLTEKALQNNIPPEILKAIAWLESSWRQFDTNGNPVIALDGGIGLMQLTPGVTGFPELDNSSINAENVERLKTDIGYNIDMGIRVLLQKWNWTGNIIPRINNGSRDVIDHWYFAAIAYNGLGQVNDPTILPRPTNWKAKTYQDSLYETISGSMGLAKLTPFPLEELVIRYNGNTVMNFRDKMQYYLPGPVTKTKHTFKAGDVVVLDSAFNLRQGIGTTTTSLGLQNAGTMLTIISGPHYSNNRLQHYAWYEVERADGVKGYMNSGGLENIRIFGATRYSTASEISRKAYGRADTVILTRGDDFTDGLAGAPLAYRLGAPLLLTRTDRLEVETRDEILRLRAKKVVILGGHLAINPTVEQELKNLGLEVERIAGANRYETAKLIADRLGTQHQRVIVVNAEPDAFSDAMAIAPYAARNGIPILLTDRNSIPKETRPLLDSASETFVIGGHLVVSDATVAQMKGVRRFPGATRYDTANLIVRELHTAKTHAYVASGLDVTDGITAAVLAAANPGHAIVLTDPASLPNVSRDLLREFSTTSVLGGHLAISNQTVRQVMRR